MKTIYKFVITGGPCAGKSTGMSMLVDELTKRGYKIFVVPETATEMLTAGAVIGENGVPSRQFQSFLLRFQTYKETMYQKFAALVPQEKILILCDRGMLDNKAYCTEEEFADILKDMGLTEVQVRDGYDAVFHLVTAANGAENFYTTENNIVRTETPEQARDLDEKIIRSWSGHPHLRVIDNSTDFKAKMTRLLNEILNYLGEPLSTEIERKFLIRKPDLEDLMARCGARKIEIQQTYLKSSPGEEKRIRQCGMNGEYAYYLTTKRELTHRTRIEIEQRISSAEYLGLMLYADPGLYPIRKDRYCFVYQNQYFELDIFPFWKDRAILEIELSDENQEIVLPEFIRMIREVTDNEEYKNHSLAKRIPE